MFLMRIVAALSVLRSTLAVIHVAFVTRAAMVGINVPTLMLSAVMWPAMMRIAVVITGVMVMRGTMMRFVPVVLVVWRPRVIIG